MPAGKTSDVSIGGRGSSNTLHTPYPVLTAILFDTELTAAQIATIQSAWNRVLVGRGRTNTPFWHVQRDDTSPLVRLDFSTIDGDLRDLSGNDIHFTNEHVTIEQEAPVGKAGVADGADSAADHYAVNTSVSLDDLDPFSIAFWLKIDSNGETSGRIFSKGTIDLYTNPSAANTQLYMQCVRAGGTAFWNYTVGATAALKDWFHVVITYDRSNASADPIFYVNNAAVALTTSSQETGAFSTDAAVDFYLFDQAALNRQLDGFLNDVRIYEKILTPAEVESIYMDGALKYYKYVNQHELTTTLSNLAAGARVGPYHAITAAHLVDEDSNGRRFLQMPSGDVTLKSKFSYGSWYVKMYCVGTVYISFVQSFDADWSNALNDGYMVGFADTNPFYLYRVDNGAATTLNNTGTYASGVEHEFFISRNSADSKFYTWIRGGAFSTWTALHSAIQDATYIDSKFMNINALGTAGCKIYDIHHYEGYLAPTDVPSLVEP
jgi:hypothetical protein